MTGARWRSALTVQGWLNVVLAAMGAVVLAGGVVGALLLHRTDTASADLVDNLQPTRIAAYQLQASLRDQGMAVRGFMLTADPVFIDLYDEGREAEAVAAETIRERLSTRTELVGDLDEITRAAEQWRTAYAEPAIASVTSRAPGPGRRMLTEQAESQFEVLRSLFDAQNVRLADARDHDVAAIATMREWRDRTLAATVVAFLITGILFAVIVRAAVTRPLGALAGACRRVVKGNFGEPIPRHGPRDIRAIATDVDDMRRRIVDELDATGEAQAELRRSNAELEQFAYVASHDLQEPLRKVTAFCQLLEKRYGDQFDERGLQYLTFAVDGAKRMQRLINDLLTFSRVGRLGTVSARVDLDETLDAAMANLAATLEESRAEIRRPTELPAVAGDPTLLTMLWQNLIGNAVKFQRPDTAPRIVIDAAVGTGEHDGDLLITLSDNGIGIDEEFVDKVFVIFQRLHGRDAYAGTGIGLALVKKIVEYHGGTIWIDTSYEGGTRFCFTLPTAAPDADMPADAVLEGSAP